jgi:hypothetical protein
MSYTLEQIKQKIKELIGHDVISTEYINTLLPIQIKCTCGVIYEKSLKSVKAGYYHCNGKITRSKRAKVVEINCEHCQKVFKPRLSRTRFCSLSCSHSQLRSNEYRENMSKIKTVLKSIICPMCNKEFQPSHSNTKMCSKKCYDDYQRTDEIREKAVLNGQKAGLKSAQSQQRRSKNEVCFAEMCEGYFGKDDVVCNEAMFDGWDADVIILSRKMAVLWNGPWHYQQIMKTQSLKQVQARDAIKWNVIEKYGYTPFVIKDTGKHNPKFVKQEFECFLFSLISL